MKQQHAHYQVVPYPKYRRWMAAEFRSTRHKPMIHGLLEVDVSGARAFVRAQKARTGESLSFTAFLIACLAKAVDEHKAVQAIRFGSKRLLLFDEVDVLTDIERDVVGQKYIIPYIIRAANRKTFRELHEEIRAAQVQDMAKTWEGFKSIHWLWLLLLPAFRVMAWRTERSPQLRHDPLGLPPLSLTCRAPPPSPPGSPSPGTASNSPPHGYVKWLYLPV